MSTKLACRLLVDPVASGAWNMAADEVLLESAARDGVATLRFYRWSEPTLSLGYFQGVADREGHASSRNAPAVRRASGGGAILHDRELTYSIALPPGGAWGSRPIELYEAFHETLISALALWGVQARQFAAGPVGGCGVLDASRNAETFLCFMRRSCGDVLVDRFKVCGSAQRRHRGAVLQHGSVLLGVSIAAPELPGLAELTGTTLHELELIAAWQPRLAARLNVRFAVSELTPSELAEVRRLTLAKYAASDWLEKR